MATYVTQIPNHNGAQLTFVQPPASGDIAPCASQASLMVVNPGANGTVTVALTPASVDGLTVATRTVSIAQGTTELIPLPPAVYGPTVTLTYTGTLTTVNVAVISTPGN